MLNYYDPVLRNTLYIVNYTHVGTVVVPAFIGLEGSVTSICSSCVKKYYVVDKNAVSFRIIIVFEISGKFYVICSNSMYLSL